MAETYTITCTDGEIELSSEDFQLLRRFSQTIDDMLSDINDDELDCLPIGTISKEVFGVIMEYCHLHKDDDVVRFDEDALDQIRREFVRTNEIGDERDKEFAERINGESAENANYDLLQPLIMGSNYLHIQGLLELIARIYAQNIRKIHGDLEPGSQEAITALKQHLRLEGEPPLTDEQENDTRQAMEIVTEE